MTFQKQFLKDAGLMAIGIFTVLLAILLSTQSVNLLGKAADGRVALEAVAVLLGFWILGMTPLLLALTAYISTLAVLTRYWRDSEMAIWLASGLSLRRWFKPVAWFVVPLAILVAVMQLSVLPWAELRSREYSEILKQKQDLSLIEAGEFRPLGKKNDRVYFVEQFDTEKGLLRNLFIRENTPDGRDNVIFARLGYFSLEQNQRTLVLEQGLRYNGVAGQGDFEQVAFERLDLIMNHAPKLLNPIDHRRTIPTSVLLNSNEPKHQAELMWRLSLPISVLLLGFLAIPLSYFNVRSGTSYHILAAVGFFLVYQNGLTFLRNAIEKGSISFWVGLLPMHLLILLCMLWLLHIRSMPALPFWQAAKSVLKGRLS